jgi:hypothetical protein
LSAAFVCGFFLGVAFFAALFATALGAAFLVVVFFAFMILSLLENVFRYPTDGVVSSIKQKCMP